jgi:hypothetical protein
MVHFFKAVTFGAVHFVILPFAFLVTQLWSFGAIYYCSFPSHPDFRPVAAWAYAFLMVVLLIASRKHARFLFVALMSFCAIAIWFYWIQPPASGGYPNHLVMPTVEFQGDQVTIHNVRNCQYRTRDDFDVRYETRTYSLNDVKTVDVLVNYWGFDWISHTFLSFGFSDGQYLTVSAEVRPEVGELPGDLKGLFKQYELIYIWGDERDLVRVRTNYRNEDVYLFRSRLAPDAVRKLLISMLEKTQRLARHPEFYNTITQSCTNNIGDSIVKPDIFSFQFWRRKFLTGAIDRRLYKEGLLETKGRPFAKVRAVSRINDRARAADQAADFSNQIRTHLIKN